MINELFRKKAVTITLLILTFIAFMTGCSSQRGKSLTEQYKYDSEGKFVCKIAPDGSKTEYKYNNQALPIEVRYPGGWVRYGYDENGNRSWMKDKTGITEYYYDAFDRLVGVIWKHSPWQLIIYDYDPWGYLNYMAIFNMRVMEQDRKYREMLREFEMKQAETVQRWQRRELTLQRLVEQLRREDVERRQRWQEYEVRYRHDILGNLTSIDTKWGSIKYFYYPDKGQIERRLPNGITTSFTYSPDGLLNSLRHENSTGKLIAEYRYDYNAAGKVINVHELTPEGSKTTGYIWDTRGYLKELHLPDGKRIRYDYDAMGNRILKEDATGTLQYDYDKFGRLAQAGNIRYEWNRNGNLLSQVERQYKTRIRYDGRNLPTFVRIPGATTYYDWDGDGNMISRRMGKDITHYLPNLFAPPGFTLAEFDKTGKLAASYLYGDVLLGQRDISGQMKYFLEDGFNSIRHITDMNGKIVGQRDYTPFGEPITMEGDMAWHFRRAGERFLPEIKSYAIEGRLYDPELGRYLTPEPSSGYIERFDSFNKYAHGCNAAGSFMEPRCNQTHKKGNQGIFQGGIYYPSEYSHEEIKGRHFYKDRVYAYVDDWINRNGPGPITLMVRGMQHRLDEGENYARDHFPGHRVLVLPSYEGTEPRSWRGVTDLFRTLGDRASPFRNLNLPELWAYLKSKGYPVIVSIHESGANHDLAKNVRYIIAAKQGGQEIPLLVPTSGNIPRKYEEDLLKEEVRVLPSVTDPRDYVGKVTKSPAQVAGEIPMVGGLLGNIPVVNITAGEASKLWSVPGLFFGGKIRWVPGWGYGLHQHAQHPSELLKIIEKEEAEIGKEKPDKGKGQEKRTEERDRKKYKRRQDEYPPPPPPPPPPLAAGIPSFNIILPLPPDDGNGSGSSVGSISDPFKSVEKQLGGIEFPAAGEFIGNLGNITGAVFDPEKQCLVLVGEKDSYVSSIKPEDLAVSLMSVFGPIQQDPQFSLDPDDPRNPKGEWLKAVYIPREIIGGTSFGEAMFEADWLLKQYSFGVSIDENGKLQERKSSVPGFKSTADLSLEEQKREYGKERWARSWIVADDKDNDKEHNMTLKQTNDGKAIYFDRAEMAVRAREVVPDASRPTGLRDVDTEEDYVATKFANLFTELYDEIAKESPEFERVRELAKAVALAKWLKKEGISVDMDWVVEYANKRIETVGKITAISVQWQKQNQELYSERGLTGIQTTIHQLHLFGGIDLTVKPKYVPDDGRAWSLQEAVRSKLREKNAGPLFTVEHNGKSFQAVVLPITRSGREMWKGSSSTESDGVIYQFSNRGEVTKTIDKAGNTIEYEYDSNRNLKKVRISNSSGWEILGERSGDSSLWTVTNPKGTTLRYKYGSSGYLSEIEVDGHTWANYEFDKDGREAIMRYDGYVERIAYDESSNIRKYEIRTEKDSPISVSDTETLIFDYDKSGNLTNISGVGVPSTSISYTGDSVRPATITTPQAETRYSYHSDGRVKEITHSSGISATYVYDGEQLTKLQVDNQGIQAEYRFNKDGIAQSRDLLGGVADYGYTNGILSSVKLAQYGDANYVYDDQNRLREIRFPDGSRIEYQYGEGKTRRRIAIDSQRQELTVVTHPAPKPYEGPQPVKRKPLERQTITSQLDAMFRQVEENSDENAAVLLIQKHNGQTYKKFSDRAEMSISSDIKDALDIIFGKKLGNRQEAEQNLRTILSDVANDGRTVIVWTPGEQFGHKLSLFLTRHMGVRAVVTDNLIKARENLTKHQPVGGNTSLVLVDATMLKAQQEAIEKEVEQMSFPVGKIAHSLQDIPVESNIVVVVAENNPRDKVTFFRQLQAAGKAGKLKDKFIVLQYCGESKPEVAKKIIDHGAVGVFFYERKISVPAVRLILREADKVIQERPLMKADEVFRDAIKRVIDGIDSGKPEYDLYKHLKQLLEDMLNNFTIVQRQTDVIEKVAIKQLELVKYRAG